MTPAELKSARRRLGEIVKQAKEGCGYRKSDALEACVASFEALPAADLRVALWIAAERLYSEKERVRVEGLREYAFTRNGQMVVLALLEQTFAEARVCVRRELVNAFGALEQAEWDRYLLGTCEDRARERGIDPDETEVVLGDFIDFDEAREMHATWRSQRAA